ncbi:class IV adenylate cyclase [Thermomonospora curvata]|uniref:CYTH domain-containing protein n=1 Tax=Thermomonospora curvata (strain ATCC 19995 / DSM 43183 / JCM 3096 / KCTC 9072 / NBRC 15933 / NCIMB 10081 / Henssen B9) TaxID=471852 RepID=D1AEG8_THECD|nr:CYTH domain-containing protein [Thermomonospora curvata]ACY95784.1 hypothetical protein Tcur_0179 [Thermomonospora curvata DSM 43183]
MTLVEFEAKLLDIDPEEMACRIESAGGRRTSEDRLQRRYVFDIDTPPDPARWMRLRDDGVRATLAVKHIVHDGIDGTKEVEVSVDDFDQTLLLLQELGYKPKSYQENRRTSFQLGEVHLEVDEWPLIPPYLELEGPSKEAVLAAADRLGIEHGRLTGINTVEVYRRYGMDITDYPELRFDLEGGSRR